MNHFTNDKPVPCSIGDISFNVGTDHDWTRLSSSHISQKISRRGETYMDEEKLPKCLFIYRRG